MRGGARGCEGVRGGDSGGCEGVLVVGARGVSDGCGLWGVLVVRASGIWGCRTEEH